MVVVWTRIRGLTQDHRGPNPVLWGSLCRNRGLQNRGPHGMAAENPCDIDIREGQKPLDERPRDIGGKVPFRAVEAGVLKSESHQSAGGHRSAVGISKRKCEIGIPSTIVAPALRDVSSSLLGEISHAEGESGMGVADYRAHLHDRIHQTVGAMAVSSLDSRGKHGEPSPLPGKCPRSKEGPLSGISSGEGLWGLRVSR